MDWKGGLLHGGGLIFQTSYCYHPKRMLELRPQLSGASSPLVEPDSSRLSKLLSRTCRALKGLALLFFSVLSFTKVSAQVKTQLNPFL